MKSIITKSLAAALAVGALFAVTPRASAETIYVSDGGHGRCDHYVECYRGDHCYSGPVRCQIPVDRGCYHEITCYHEGGCYHEPVCYRPSACYVSQGCSVSYQGGRCR
jgi:hypothetical protein